MGTSPLIPASVRVSSGTAATFEVRGNSLSGAKSELTANTKIVLEQRLADGSWKPMRVTTTDAKGNYSFTGLPAGQYRVRLEVGDEEPARPMEQGGFVPSSDGLVSHVEPDADQFFWHQPSAERVFEQLEDETWADFEPLTALAPSFQMSDVSR